MYLLLFYLEFMGITYPWNKLPILLHDNFQTPLKSPENQNYYSLQITPFFIPLNLRLVSMQLLLRNSWHQFVATCISVKENSLISLFYTASDWLCKDNFLSRREQRQRKLVADDILFFISYTLFAFLEPTVPVFDQFLECEED